MAKKRKIGEGDLSVLASKAIWTDELTLVFCELCAKEVEAGNRPTIHLSTKGWENVIAQFKARTQKNYLKPQLKNKWDTLKKEWRLWRELLENSTGLGWCPLRNTVDATVEWWIEKIQENPDYKGFKKKGIEPRLEELMWQIVFPNSQYTVARAMDALRALEDEIPKKHFLYYFAIKAFQVPVKREIFLNLDLDIRTWWLQSEYDEQNATARFSSLLAQPFQQPHPPHGP